MENKTWREKCQEKIVAPEKLENLLEKLRKKHKTIATLNGSFDLLHAGHLHMIMEAKEQADVLIMAINTDASIQKYKDPSRPIIPLEHRLKMLSALAFVDYVTWFEQTDPCAILEKIRPNVHVNGAEYGENCIEAPVVRKYGGKIHIVRLIEGLSTTNILKKIQQCVS